MNSGAIEVNQLIVLVLVEDRGLQFLAQAAVANALDQKPLDAAVALARHPLTAPLIFNLAAIVVGQDDARSRVDLKAVAEAQGCDCRFCVQLSFFVIDAQPRRAIARQDALRMTGTIQPQLHTTDRSTCHPPASTWQFKIEIVESVEYLEKSLDQARTVSQKEKLQMLYWLKCGLVKQHQELAQRLERDPSTVSRWLQKYRQGGIGALLEVKTSPGQPRKIDGEMLERLQERLKQPQGFKSYIEIEQWLQQEFGATIKYKTVHKTVRYRLKAKLKVPRPQSHKQDPQALSLFKKTSPSPC